LSYAVFLDPRVARALKRFEPSLRERIKLGLRELQESPETKGERLNPSDYWKIRIGDYRAIFQINKKTKSIVVLFVGHRSKVYDDFGRML
jgi:mRNA interferase RelE/StbE